MKRTNVRRRRFFFDLKKHGDGCKHPESRGRKSTHKSPEGDADASETTKYQTTA